MKKWVTLALTSSYCLDLKLLLPHVDVNDVTGAYLGCYGFACIKKVSEEPVSGALTHTMRVGVHVFLNIEKLTLLFSSQGRLSPN